MLWLGTYQEKGGQGLYSLGPDLLLGPPEPRIADASYAVWAAETGTAYFVCEQQVGCVGAWRLSENGWVERGSHETGGALPCYLSLSPDRSLLAVANYGDGSVALLELDPASGRIRGLSDIMRSEGRGPDPERQEGPHAHCALFDESGGFLYHVDLGQDWIFRHRLEGGRFAGTEVAFAAPPGAGPRHLAFHPDGRHALLLTELSAELFLLARTETGLELLDRTATAPEALADNLGGHLALLPDGTILVSNRGHDSLVSFAIADGRLERGGSAQTGAASPRHFHVGTSGVLVAHEEGQALSLVRSPPVESVGAGPRQCAPAPGAAYIFAIPDR